MTTPAIPVRVIPHTGPRVETGAVQFGDDWPGLFVRGDNAMAVMMAIHTVLSIVPGVLSPVQAGSAKRLREVAATIEDVVFPARGVAGSRPPG